MLIKCLSVLFFIIGFHSAWAIEIPALTGPVIDQVGYLEPQDEQKLSQALLSLNQSGIAQVQVLIVSTIENESIEQVALKVAETWKLGDVKKDNGVLLLIAAKDRKLRIEVGQGLEGDLPDVIAKRIISDVMVPYLKAGQTSLAVLAGTQQIIKYVAPDFKMSGVPEKKMRKKKSNLGNWIEIIGIIFFVLISLLSPGGGRRRGLGGVFLGGGGGYGGGSGGSSWGGGGGGFSGGGSSGSW